MLVARALRAMERDGVPRTEFGQYDWFLVQVRSWMLENPGAFAAGFFRKAAALWWFPKGFATRYYEWVPRPAVFVYKVLYGVLLALALLGCIRAVVSPVPRNLVLAAAAYLAAFTFLHGFFIAAGRHKVMILPLIVVFAGHGLAAVGGRFLPRRPGGRR